VSKRRSARPEPRTTDRRRNVVLYRRGAVQASEPTLVRLAGAFARLGRFLGTRRRVTAVGLGNEESWAVETSRDGSQWRWLGKAWKSPNEAVLMHVSVRFIRFRQLLPSETKGWSEPLETQGKLPMTMVHMEEGQREDLWPGDEHLGLPMLLPGGETGRLLTFDHALDGSSWRYTLEFRGVREG
jgi:hypothetical protein